MSIWQGIIEVTDDKNVGLLYVNYMYICDHLIYMSVIVTTNVALIASYMPHCLQTTKVCLSYSSLWPPKHDLVQLDQFM